MAWDPGPRRMIAEAGFDLTIDAGLPVGGRPHSYLDMLVHSFPLD